MSFAAVVAGMLAVTFGSRLAGLTLQGSLPPFWLRFLHFVPVSVFAALIAPSLAGDNGEAVIRIVAAAGGALAVWRVRQLWVAIAVGMILFWLLRVPF